MHIHDATATAALLPFERLVPAMAQAMQDLHSGLIHARQRTVLPLPEGGTYLAMPCADARYAVTKLVAITPANRHQGLPTLQGRVIVNDARHGTPLAVLDGPELTARRTAAVTLLGINTLTRQTPTRIALVGTGAQARMHALAMAELWPGVALRSVGRPPAQSEQFVAHLKAQHPTLNICALPLEHALHEACVVVTATTSLSAVLPEAADAIDPSTLIVGVGSFTPQMAELPARAIQTRQVWVDDWDGAQHEAGDLLQAKVNWRTVRPLHEALAQPQLPQAPMLLKTVGHAAWDLAAVRVALN
ncbi:delta(1)-pyrroline-2-carboxylate reductase family protein [Roseateles koreensis]|uniref:Delta(1)-pyrroline-2-carboxylate reductase family protein n=1 Tax=Roseateles koreensis TaxID=2987526 RepID=A0ABT5KMS8_9BURK|nr:delta(1)-pyrroline-2-carboxylate reductase family protein [Roseateles koreensis]MDC8784228.1 delta(1)-pyrroline-2-carboxylate reductase family protein [Roseateles koreensis]